MVEVRVEITEDDILHGRQRNCFLCPGALAVRRHVDAFTKVEVSSHVRFIQQMWTVEQILGGNLPEPSNPELRGHRTETIRRDAIRLSPTELLNFVETFDKQYGYGFAKPTVFYLDIPNHCYIGGGE